MAAVLAIRAQRVWGEMQQDQAEGDDGRRGLIKSPTDMMAGIFLVAFGLFCLWASSNLNLGRGANLGPGSFPRGLSLMIMAVGAIIIVQALTVVGPKLEAWSIRGPIFVLGAVVLFAIAVRPLGLVIAGPLCLFFAAFASREIRWVENIIFATLMTAGCILLFKVALKLPIPVAPWAGW
jgi:putative tricarboxylic transport membrane protein